MTEIKRYLVGGAVRDQLLGRKSKDLDYVVEAPSFEAMEAWLLEQGHKIYLSKPEFNVIRSKSPDGEDADHVLARKEGPYSDHRRPDWTEPGTLMDDLARRDLTINAIAMNEDGTLIDPFNGQADLKYKTIRAVGHPIDRFGEDPLRVYRAFRFSITLGFKIEIATKNAMSNAVVLAGLESSATSAERIQLELSKAFRADPVYATLTLARWYPELLEIAVRKGVWLEPTLKGR